MSSEEIFTLEYYDAAKKEYEKLDGSQKIFVDKALNRIKIYGMQCGQKLRGTLIGCNKLKNKKMGLRIVFRQEDQKIRIIQIIAIGKRDNLEVYNDASQRLSNQNNIE